MGRLRRPDLPGLVVHLTARTIRRERTFTPELRTATLGVLAKVVPQSGARLLAVAVMSNHLHLVVQQGEPRLPVLMQPLLRRLAHLLQKAHGFDGPALWRPYGSQPCFEPVHARNAIAYTHLNPVRAGICTRPEAYPWSSHELFAKAPNLCPLSIQRLGEVLDPVIPLRLFATGRDRAESQLREDYRAFIEWRLSTGALEDDSDAEARTGNASGPPPSLSRRGWGATFSPLFHAPVRRGPRSRDLPRAAPPDMAALARITLAAETPGLSVDSIKRRGGGSELSRLRHLVIRRLHAAGYPNVEIARFLRISESAVSYAIRRAGG